MGNIEATKLLFGGKLKEEIFKKRRTIEEERILAKEERLRLKR